MVYCSWPGARNLSLRRVQVKGGGGGEGKSFFTFRLCRTPLFLGRVNIHSSVQQKTWDVPFRHRIRFPKYSTRGGASSVHNTTELKIIKNGVEVWLRKAECAMHGRL